MTLPIRIDGLCKSYGRKSVLQGLDLRCEPGTVTAVLGSNGSGKSTLIRCVLGLNVPETGTIKVFGESVSASPAYRRHIGYMPQHPSFPENLTVHEILQLVSRTRNVAPDFNHCASLQVEAYLGQRWKTLSGGMKQRVNAFLAMAFNPSILILDEPTASLDPASRIKFMELVKAEKQRGKTLLFSTHLLEDIREVADYLVFLRNGKAHRVSMQRMMESPNSLNPHAFEQAVAVCLEEPAPRGA